MLYKARDLLAMTSEQLMLTLPDRLDIKFDNDEVVSTSKRKVLYSDCCWDILRYYNETPFISSHLVDSVLDNSPSNSDTHRKLLNNIYESVVYTYNLFTPESKEHLLLMVYEATDKIDNVITRYAEADVTSIDALDMIEVLDHPEIKNINNKIIDNSLSINKGYDDILSIIKDSASLSKNNLVKAVRSKMVNANQILQCISVRGFPTEVDGTILSTPILTNYAKGLNTLYDFVAESRSAAKALYFSEAPLQDAEYFARRLQLLTMVVEGIHYEDCGTNKYFDWYIEPPRLNEKGDVVYAGDLKFMVGKYYLDERTNQLAMLTEKDKHLNGTTIKMRTVLHCEHKDPHKVCHICFGGLSGNISKYSNLGHICSATMTEQTSQSVLSTKHLDASGISNNIELNEYTARYLTTNSTRNSYLVKKSYEGKQVKLVVPRDDLAGLTVIHNLESVENMNPLRVSSIEQIDFTYMEKNRLIHIPLVVSQENRKAMFTMEMIRYLKEHRWETDQRGNFVISLDNWNFDLPVMTLPDMEYSYSDHSQQISKIIESSVKDITNRQKPNSPFSTLQELFVLVNSKLNVNIAALEVIIYATMVPNNNDFNLARHSEKPVLGVADQIIKNRSESAALAYEEVAYTLTNAKSFFKLDRPDSVFDVFVAPNQVVEKYRS